MGTGRAQDISLITWWVSFRSPFEIWENHPSYLIVELAIILLALLTLQHAIRSGGRYPYLWISAVLHGLTVEAVSYFLPDIDSFWHGQSSVMFLGGRLPLHIICFYPAFLYLAVCAAQRLYLPALAQACATGLAVVILDVPFDIMGIKSLWWTWHDTDPNIFDRHYWVPWTSYYFHATFAFSLCFLFHGSRKVFTSKPSMERDGFFKEAVSCIIVGLFSMPMGILQFIPWYHPLHDMLGIHTEVPVLAILLLYVLIVWKSDRNPVSHARQQGGGRFDELGLHVVIHYSLYLVLVLVSQPEKIRSIGLHEPTGDCNATSDMFTAFGQVLKKKKFLCTTNYDEGYYDWHCLKGGNPPKDGLDWYTVCGTPFTDHAEYIIVVSAFCLLGLFVFYQMLACSGPDPPARQRVKTRPEPPVLVGKVKTK